MTWLTTKIDNITKPLNLDSSIDWLNLVGGLEEQIKKYDISSLHNKNAIEVLGLLIENPDKYGSVLAPVFARLLPQKNFDEIIAEWAKIKDKYNSEQTLKLRALAVSFESFSSQPSLPKLIKWKPLDDTSTQDVQLSDQASFNIGAMTKLGFELEALPRAPNLPAGVELNQIAEKALLRIGINGDLSVNGRFGFAADLFNVGVGANAGASVEADLYFLERQDTRFGIAVAENLDDLVNCDQGERGICSPFNAKSLNHLLTRDGLHCLRMEAGSTLTFDGSIGIGKSFSSNDKIKMRIGVAADFNIQNKGKFEYLLAADQVAGEPVIAIQIKRVDGKESELNESLGIELDPRKLVKSLQPIIEHNLGKAEAILTEFKDLLPGSDFINEKLTAVIDAEFNDEEFRDAIRAMVGLDPNKPPEEVLRDRIIGVIETSTEGWSEDITTIFDDVVRGVARYVPQISNTEKDRIDSAIKKSVAEKQKALIDTVKDKLEQNDGFARIANKLNEASTSFNTNIVDAQAQLNAVTYEVKKQLQALQKSIGKVRELTQVATEKTISMKLSGSRKEIEQESLNLRFDLYANRTGAQEALDAILLGDMRQVFKLVRDQKNMAEPAIIGHTGSFKVYESLTDERLAGLIIWDFTLLSKAITSADVEWTINLDGSISARSEAKYERTNENKWFSRETRLFSFIESSTLLFADPGNTSGQRQNTLNLGLILSDEEEELSAKEVKAFFDGLVQRNLLPASSVAKAVAKMREIGDKKLTKGRLEVGLNLENEQFDAMMSGVENMRTPTICNDEFKCFGPNVKCPDNAGRKGCHWVLDTVSRIQAEVFTQQHSDRHTILRLNETIDNRNQTPAKLAAAIRAASSEGNFFNTYGVQINYAVPQIDEISLADFSFLEYRRYGAMAMYEILAHMKALYETKMIRSDQDDNDFTAEGWTPKSLKAHQTRIARLVAIWSYWADEKYETLSLTDKMRASNVALFESWTEMAKGPNCEGTTPKLWATISLPTGDDSGTLKTTQLT